MKCKAYEMYFQKIDVIWHGRKVRKSYKQLSSLNFPFITKKSPNYHIFWGIGTIISLKMINTKMINTGS